MRVGKSLYDIFYGLGSDPDADLANLKIRIRTKNIRIRNTVWHNADTLQKAKNSNYSVLLILSINGIYCI
jgi:hypothetical protein